MIGCLFQPPAGNLACNPAMCPDWESDWPLFCPQAGTQSTEPHQPRVIFFSRENWDYEVSERNTTEVKYLPYIPGVLSTSFITDEVNPHHLATALLARFLHCKVTSHPFLLPLRIGLLILERK